MGRQLQKVVVLAGPNGAGKERVRAGGHDVPEQTVRRRYAAGLRNLRTLYLPLANSWKLIDNTNMSDPRVVAAGKTESATEIYCESAWQSIMKMGKEA